MNHPNVCTVYDIGEQDGRPFLVMELMEGKTLKDRIAEGPLSNDQLLAIMTPILEALESAHGVGLVHRDIKPANIFLTRQGPVKILDFGLAKSAQRDRLQDSLTATGTTLGTISYMSPEQARGQDVDARSDLFSCGVVLYEMATGTLAFPGDGFAVAIEALVTRAPRPARELRRDLLPEIERAIDRALEKDPAVRYQSAADMRADLLRAKRIMDSLSAPVVAAPIPKPKSRRKGTLVAGAMLIAALIAGYFLFYRPLHAAPKLTDQDTIVVADFVNKTGDPAFDDTLREGLIVQLQQSPFLSLVSDQKIRATVKLMGKPADVSLTAEVAREVCERVGARAVVVGSITSLGTHYVMNLRADLCSTGDALDHQQADASGKDQVLKTLGDIATRFRSRAGESLATIREHNVPLEEATTPSLEALKAFSSAVEKSGTSYGQSPRQLQRATEHDPRFKTTAIRLVL